MVGLFALLPQVVDAVSVPVIAAGGIGDARGVAAALVLGASAAMIGTGFLRCPEARLNRGWADTLSKTEADETMITSAFTGRPGRGVANEYAARFGSAECAVTGAVSPATRPDASNARGGIEGRGRRANADVGGTSGETSADGTGGRGCNPEIVGGGFAFLVDREAPEASSLTRPAWFCAHHLCRSVCN